MHRKVELALLQCDSPTATEVTHNVSNATTTVTTMCATSAAASSPCVRDVCDAIIVHALRQRSDSDQSDGEVERAQMCAVDVKASSRLQLHDYVEPQMQLAPPQSRMSDSVLCSASHVTDADPSSILAHQSSFHFTKSSNLCADTFATVQSNDSGIDSMSRVTDSTQNPQHLDGSKSSDLHSEPLLGGSNAQFSERTPQVTDFVPKQSRWEVVEPNSGPHESCVADFQSRLTESKTVCASSHAEQSFHVEQTFSQVVAALGDEGIMKKSDAEESPSQEDVDLEEQPPLCIDLNRDDDTWPDSDADAVNCQSSHADS